MRTFRAALLLFLYVFAVLPLTAGTYYVDFDGGNDANDGLSPATAWRTMPGTLTVDDTSLLGNWGPFNAASPIPAGSTIYLKGGTTYSVADPGGSIYVQGTGGSKDVYTSSGSGYGAGVTITTLNGFGSGPVTFDGTGKTNGIALLILGMSGITLDGTSTNNIIFQNTSGDGIQLKEQHGTGNENLYIWIQYLYAKHCGRILTNDLAGAGSGHLNLRHANHFRLTKIEVDGLRDTNYINGILLGDNGKWIKDGIVWDINVHGLLGDPGPNDSGIGLKGLNSQIWFTNIVSFNNLKGMDLGEQSGSGGYDLTYWVQNSNFYTNAVSGLGLTGKAAAYNGLIKYWVWNNRFISNNNFGINCYSTPQLTYIANNAFAYNGDTALSGAYAGHIRANPNSSSDTNNMQVYIYNNVFFKPADCQICGTDYSTPVGANGTDYTQYSDWNTYVQTSSEFFAQWAYFNGSEFLNVDYANGPGHPAGTWAADYSNNTTPPIRGTGHFGSDNNSTAILSGAAEASAFWLVQWPTYSVNTNRNGTNISSASWYDSRMGLDLAGNTRSTYWTRGLYEYQAPAAGPTPAPGVQGVKPQNLILE